MTATIVARDGGEPSTVRAEYLIAADGNDSGVRSACGIGRTGDADMGHFVNIFHRAALGPLVRDRPGWSYAVITPEISGSFVTIDGDDIWLFHVNLAPGETVEDFTEQRCVETIRAAAGVEDLDVEILSIKSWIMGAELSTAFRDRRVLLTGDAAHRTTPDGGVGMNTGLHSAHNLAWKVGAVVSGWAGPDLLDTYETERRAVAETNVAYSARRGSGMIKMIEAVRAGDLDTVRAGIAGPAGRAAVRAWTSASATRRARWRPTEPRRRASRDPVAEYVQNACPGGRAPHMWVQRDGERVSTLDLFGRGVRDPHRSPRALRGARPRRPPRNGSRSTCSQSVKAVTSRRRTATSKSSTGSNPTARCWSGPTASSAGALDAPARLRPRTWPARWRRSSSSEPHSRTSRPEAGLPAEIGRLAPQHLRIKRGAPWSPSRAWGVAASPQANWT